MKAAGPGRPWQHRTVLITTLGDLLLDVIASLDEPLAPDDDAPAGLAAFEDAPCFLELVEREAQRSRDGGGEMETGRSKPE